MATNTDRHPPSRPTVTISCANLFTHGPRARGKPTERWPLTRLGEGYGHIHGLLTIRINGAELPIPSDACIGEWAGELGRLRDILWESPRAEYTIDEAEQGGVGYRFQRDGRHLFVSIVAGSGGGDPHPECQRDQARWHDMDTALRTFKAQLLELLAEPLGHDAAQDWIDLHL